MEIELDARFSVGDPMNPKPYTAGCKTDGQLASELMCVPESILLLTYRKPKGADVKAVMHNARARIVGYAMMTKVGAKAFNLMGLHVDPQFHKKTIGSAMLKHMLSVATKAECKVVVYAPAHPAYVPAVKMFVREGFMFLETTKLVESDLYETHQLVFVPVCTQSGAAATASAMATVLASSKEKNSF